MPSGKIRLSKQQYKTTKFVRKT